MKRFLTLLYPRLFLGLIAFLSVMDIQAKPEPDEYITIEGVRYSYNYYGAENLTATVLGLEAPSSITKLVLQSELQPVEGSFTYRVYEIDKNAFIDCAQLTGELQIPNSVKRIGDGAFMNCSGFTKLVVGEGAETIGSNAFSGCLGLQSITVLAETPPVIYGSAFSNYTIPLIVPKGTKEAYKAANDWKLFTNIMEDGESMSIDAKLSVSDQSVDSGQSFEASVDLDFGNSGSPAYSGFQFDVVLPQGITFEDYIISPQLSNDFIVSSKTSEKGIVRIIGYAYDASTTLDKGFITLKLKVDKAPAITSCAIKLNNAYLSTPDGSDIPLLDSEFIVNIRIVAFGIALNPSELTLLVGDSAPLTATVQPANVADKTIVWKSGNESVATVGTDGTVTAVSAGTATVTATCGEVTAECTVTVKGASEVSVVPGEGTHESDDDTNPGEDTATGGALNGSDLTLRVGQTAGVQLQLPANLTETPEFEWSLASGGNSIVTLAANGGISATFTGVAIGETSYTVSVRGSSEVLASGKVKVIGQNPVVSLVLNPASVSMAKNALATTITPVFTPEAPSNPTLVWSSSAETVARVNESGEVTPTGEGSCVITATTTDGTNLSATCQVTVTAPIAESFEFEFDESVMGGKEGISLYIGDSYKFVPKAQEGYVLPAISWASSDAMTVSVNDDGTVNALALGQATITATATVNNQEVKAECKVTVIPVPLESVTVTAQSTTSLRDGETVQLSAKTEPQNATAPIEIKWSSDKPEVASVNETTGLVTAHATLGTAIITATASNPADKQVTGSIEVTVIATGASRVILNAYDLTMMVGQETRLSATVEPATTTNPTINWTIDNPQIASIDSNGNITALSAGTATVTATCGEATATCTVTVKGGSDIEVVPGSGTPGSKDEDDGNGWIDGSDVYVHVNRTVNMNLTLPADLTDTPTLTWTLADGGEQYVKLVPADNTLSAAFTGIKFGETSYTVSLNGEQLLSGKVTVIAEITMNSLLLEPATLSMAQNALPVKLETKYTPAGATMPQFSWSSSDPAVATVSDDGTVTPKSQGQTTITATALDGSGLSATCEVTVTAPIAESLEFEFDESVMGGKDGISLYIGDTYLFKPKAKDGYVLPDVINWNSSNSQKVSVNDSGLVTALALGSATITASATVNGNVVKAECLVTVIPIPAQTVQISLENLTLLVGQSDKLTAKVYPENTTNPEVTWESDNEGVASAGIDGTITAISVGTAIITATCGTVSATCTVTVIPIPSESIVISPSSVSMFLGDNVTLTATVFPEDTTDKSVTWGSDNPGVASVSSNGVVTALGLGTATITARNGSVSASCQINVVHRIPDMDPFVTTSERDIQTLSGRQVNMAVYAEGGEPTGWSFQWSKDGKTVSETSELNITAINDTETVKVETYRVKVENEIDKVVILSQIFDFVVHIYPAVEGVSEEDGISISTGTGNSGKTREGNEVTLSVTTPAGGNPHGWDYVWSSRRGAVGEGNPVETVATMSAGNLMAIELTTYELAMTNYGPEGDVWAQFNLVTGLEVYRRPLTPSQMLRKGDGTSHTFVVMMPLSDTELEKLGYRYVYGWTDSDGNEHVMDRTELRYCHTDAEIYNNPTNKFWVYSIWNYSDGSMISSGLCYLDGRVDESFDASVFDGNGDNFGVDKKTRTAIYSLDGHYMGTDSSRLVPGIYIHTTETHGMVKTQKIIIR